MAVLLAIYSNDTAVVWKLVRVTWHVHSTPDDDIHRVILRHFKISTFSDSTMKVPYYVWLLILSTVIIQEYMFTVQLQTNAGVWQNMDLSQ